VSISNSPNIILNSWASDHLPSIEQSSDHINIVATLLQKQDAIQSLTSVRWWVVSSLVTLELGTFSFGGQMQQKSVMDGHESSSFGGVG
jgi:hypothetical protein